MSCKDKLKNIDSRRRDVDGGSDGGALRHLPLVSSFVPAAVSTSTTLVDAGIPRLCRGSLNPLSRMMFFHGREPGLIFRPVSMSFRGYMVVCAICTILFVYNLSLLASE